jgi:hypothetical protein
MYPYLAGRVVGDKLVDEDEGDDGCEASEVDIIKTGEGHIGNTRN